MTGDVTVVVATRNRRQELMDTLDRHDAPVVVVDNGSSDGTPEAVASRPGVRLVALHRNVGAYARTIGARVATTPYVAFADDDSWWAPGALERAVALMRDYPRLALLAGQMRVLPRDELDPVCLLMAESPLPVAADLPGTPVLGFMACGAVVHRGMFLAVGGFDDVIRFPGEEERVALDLATHGFGLAYVPEVVAYHRPSPRRDDPDSRMARVVRSRLLTACLRRPWPVVAAAVGDSVRSGRLGLRGKLAAFPTVLAALRRRAVVPDAVEAAARLTAESAAHRRASRV